MAERDAAPPSADGGTGFGGLLLLFLVMQGATFVLDLLALRTVPATFAPGTWSLGALSASYRPLVVAEAVARVLVVLLPVAGFLLTFRRSPRAPALWVAYLAVCVAYGLLEVVGTRVVVSQLGAALRARQESTAEIDRLARDASLVGARTILYGVFWGAYWLTSERVDRTFRRAPAATGVALPPPR